MMKQLKRALAFLLSFAMILALLPISALAADEAPATGTDLVETPAEEPKAPAVENKTPVVEKKDPEADDETPEVKDETPEVKDETPVVENKDPEVKDETPVVKDETPQRVQGARNGLGGENPTEGSVEITVHFAFKDDPTTRGDATVTVTESKSYAVEGETGFDADKSEITYEDTEEGTVKEFTVTFTKKSYDYTVRYRKYNTDTVIESVPGTAKFGDVISASDIEIKDLTGYTYVDGSLAPASLTFDGTGDKVFTLDYTPNAQSYTVVYADADTGTELQDSVTVSDGVLFGDGIPAPDAPAFENYAFAGAEPATLNVGADNDANIITLKYKKTVTFTVNYTLPAGKSFDDGSQSTTESVTLKYGETHNVKSVSGYKAAPAAISFDEADADEDKAFSVSYHELHTVSFNVSGAAYGTTQTVADGETATEPEPPAVPEAMASFTGWFTAAENGTKFDFDTAITGDITLYAQFTDIINVLIYNAEEGGNADTVAVKKFSSVSQPADPTQPPEGMKFKYWFDAAAGSDTPYDFTKPVTGELVLRPHFVKVFTVAFYSAGSPNPDMQQVEENGTINWSDATEIPELAGYVFDFWGEEEATAAFGDTPVTENLVLYAHWTGTPTTYRLNYWVQNSSGTGYDYAGEVANKSNLTATTGQVFTLADGTIPDQYKDGLRNTALKYSHYDHCDTTTILAEGRSIVNVYYDRTDYTLNFRKQDGTVVGSITAKFEENIFAQWKAINDSVNDSKDTAHYIPGFIRWGASFATAQAIMGAEMVQYAIDDNMYALAADDTVEVEVHYWFQNEAGSIEREAYVEKGYTQTLELSGWNHSNRVSPTLTGKSFEGFTYSFYYATREDGTETDRGTGSVTAGEWQWDQSESDYVLVRTKKVINYYYNRAQYTLTYDYQDYLKTGSGWGASYDDTTEYTLNAGLPLTAPSPTVGDSRELFTRNHGNYRSKGTFQLVGWYKESDCITKVDIGSLTMPGGDLRLYARWVNTGSIQVTFYDDITETAVQLTGLTQGLVSGDKVPYPSSQYVKGQYYEGHGVFNGWYIKINGSWAHFDFETPVTGPIDIHAGWLTEGFTVTYDAGEGSGAVPVDTNTYNMSDHTNATAAAKTDSMVAPAGKTFIGWRVSGKGRVYYAGNLVPVTGNIKLVAFWAAPGEYVTLTYHANHDGSTATQEWALDKNDSVSLAGAIFDRAGYDLTGWNTSANGQGTHYALGATYATGSTNSHLYAEWTQAKYTVKATATNGALGANGADGVKKDYEVMGTEDLTVSFQPDEGYVLKSVTVDGEDQAIPQGGMSSYQFNNVVENHTIDVVYEARSYTVTYRYTNTVSGASPLPAVAEHAYQSSVTVKAKATAAGYTFSGWTVSTDGAAAAIVDGKFQMPAGNVILEGSFAPRKDLKGTVHYYLDGTTTSVADDVSRTNLQMGERWRELPADVKGYTPTSTEEKSKIVSATESLNVITFYYTANEHTLTVKHVFNGVEDGTTTETVAFDTAVSKAPRTDVENFTCTSVTVDVTDVFTVNATTYTVTGNMPDSDVTITFNYAVGEYNVLYNANRSANDSKTESQDYTPEQVNGGLVKALDNMFENEGKVFLYWTTKKIPSTGNGSKTYYPGDVISATEFAAGEEHGTRVKLYAQWADAVTIHYEPVLIDGAKGSVSPLTENLPAGENTAAKGSTATVTPNTNSRFVGWFTDKACTVSAAGSWISGNKLTPAPKAEAWGAPDAATYYAKFIPDTATYQVQHYQQQLDGTYTLYETVTKDGSGNPLTGNVGDTATAVAKSYTGFTENKTIADRVPSGTILADNSLTLKLYYDRNSYDLTVQHKYGTAATVTTTDRVSTAFGTTINEAPVARDGYALTSVTKPAALTEDSTTHAVTGTMPAANTTIVFNYTAQTVDYKVQHWLEKLEYEAGATGENRYDLKDTETKQGVTDETTAAVAKDTTSGDYLGFTAVTPITQLTIKGDGTTVVNIYYNRNTYQVSYEYTNDPAIQGAPALPEAAGYRYGAEVTVKGTPTMDDYDFTGWTVKDSLVTPADNKFDMPASDVVLQGSWDIKASVTISYVSEDTNKGTVAPPTNVITNVDTTNSVSGSKATAKDGYVFVNWTKQVDGKDVEVSTNATFAPAKPTTGWAAIIYTAHFAPRTDVKYKVEHYQQNLDGTFPTTPAATDDKTGTYNTAADYAPKDYTTAGFTYDATQTTWTGKGTETAPIVPAADDTLVIRLYYTRNSYDYSVEYRFENKTTHVFETDPAKTDKASAKLGKALSELYPSAAVIGSKNKTGYYYKSTSTKDGATAITTAAASNVIYVDYAANGSITVTLKDESVQHDGSAHYLGGDEGDITVSGDSDIPAGKLPAYATLGATIQYNAGAVANPTDVGVYTGSFTGGKTTVDIELADKTVKTYTVSYDTATLTINPNVTYHAKQTKDGDDVVVSSMPASPANGTYNTAFVVSSQEPTAPGYDFQGWATSLTGDVVYAANGTTAPLTDNLDLYAVWAAGTETAYKVQHFRANIDGTYPALPNDTDNMTGTTGTDTAAAAKDTTTGDYLGFTAVTPIAQKTIKADGSTVVRIEYTRNSNALTVQHLYGTTTDTVKDAEATAYGTALNFGAKVIPDYELSGITVTGLGDAPAAGWTSPVTGDMPDNDVTIVFNYEPKARVTISYVSEDTNKGTVAPAENVITKVDSTLRAAGSTATAKDGYHFVNWTTQVDGKDVVVSTDAAFAPAKPTTGWAAITYTAHFAPNTDTAYKVEHYRENLDGTFPALPNDTDNMTGTTDTDTKAAAKDTTKGDYLGFTAVTPITQQKIKGDGTTVVRIEYKRNLYTVTFQPGDHGTLTGADQQGNVVHKELKYGADFPQANPDGLVNPAADYYFTFWKAANGDEVVSFPTIVKQDYTFTAQYAPMGTITVTLSSDAVNYDGGDHKLTATVADIPNVTKPTLAQLEAKVLYDGAEAADGKRDVGFYAGSTTGKATYQIGAKWYKVSYNKGTLTILPKIVYHENNGAATPKTKAEYAAVNATTGNSFTYSVLSAAPAEFGKTGYHFDGWYDNAACTGTAVSGTIAPSVNVTDLYAKWTANPHTVTYLLDGKAYDAGDLDGTFGFDTEIALAAKATNGGYTVSEWTIPADVKIVNGKYAMPDKDVTFTAVSRGSITVNAVSDEVYYDGQSHDLTASISLGAGQTFGSILTLADFNATLAGDGETNVKRDAVTGNVLGYDVTFAPANGGVLVKQLTDGVLANSIVYDVTYTYDGSAAQTAAKLTIKPRPVVITAGSAEQSYDGNALTDGTVIVSTPGQNTGFITGQGVDATSVKMLDTSTVKDPGTAANEIESFSLLTGTDGDNYDMELLPGTLTVHPVVTYVANTTATVNSMPNPLLDTSARLGKDYTVSSATPARTDGMVFNGWNTNANGSGTAYAVSASVKTLTDNMTLYAQWIAPPTILYRLVYLPGAAGVGNMPAETAPIYAAGAAFTVSGMTPTRDGFTFVNWRTDNLATARRYLGRNQTANIPANVDLLTDNAVFLTAQWAEVEPAQYTVTYTVNVVNAAGVTTETYNYAAYTRAEGEGIPAAGTPARAGYTFSGWTGERATMPAFNFTVTGTLTETAVAPTPELPVPPIEEIPEEETPLAGPQGAAWALLNLILAIATALASALMLIGYLGKKKEQDEDGVEVRQIKKHGVMRILSLLPGVGGIVAFILTENMKNPMVFTDKWTLLMVVIALIQLLVVLFSIKSEKDAEEQGNIDAI